jgi:phage shock protein A
MRHRDIVASASAAAKTAAVATARERSLEADLAQARARIDNLENRLEAAVAGGGPAARWGGGGPDDSRMSNAGVAGSAHELGAQLAQALDALSVSERDLEAVARDRDALRERIRTLEMIHLGPSTAHKEQQQQQQQQQQRASSSSTVKPAAAIGASSVSIKSEATSQDRESSPSSRQRPLSRTRLRF